MTTGLSQLIDNLACRQRLGLSLVLGEQTDLAGLLTRLGAAPAPAPAQSAALDLSGGLGQIRQELGECTRCPLHQGRGKIVFGQGPEDARLMFIGEGPGAEEDRQGIPFVGKAGKLLDKMLSAVGLKRSQVYIANLVKCRPPQNRDPQEQEVAACQPFLQAQINAIAPKVICTLGRPASQQLLNSTAPIGALRGKWKEAQGIPLLPTFHPAYLLRNPSAKAKAYEDMKSLAGALEK